MWTLCSFRLLTPSTWNNLPQNHQTTLSTFSRLEAPAASEIFNYFGHFSIYYDLSSVVKCTATPAQAFYADDVMSAAYQVVSYLANRLSKAYFQCLAIHDSVNVTFPDQDIAIAFPTSKNIGHIAPFEDAD
jgi:hypothetical protein